MEAKGKGKLLLDNKGFNIGANIKKALDEAGVTQDAILVSWQNISDTDISNLKEHLPDVGILVGGIPDTLTKESFDKLKENGVVGFETEYSLVTKEFIDAAHNNGMFVFVYTVMDPDTMLSLIEMGVDGIETDFPAVLDGLMPLKTN